MADPILTQDNCDQYQWLKELAYERDHDIYQNTRLHIASAGGDQNMVRHFLNRKYDVNAVNDDCRTSLHIAVSNDHFQVTQMLIKAKAIVNLQCKNGNTPLHDAVYFGASTAIFYLLLDAGADRSIKNNKGETPLNQAQNMMLKYSQQGILLQNLTADYIKIIAILQND